MRHNTVGNRRQRHAADARLLVGIYFKRETRRHNHGFSCRSDILPAYNPHNPRQRWRFSPTAFIRRCPVIGLFAAGLSGG
jgi:hypothetical protein